MGALAKSGQCTSPDKRDISHITIYPPRQDIYFTQDFLFPRKNISFLQMISIIHERSVDLQLNSRKFLTEMFRLSFEAPSLSRSTNVHFASEKWCADSMRREADVCVEKNYSVQFQSAFWQKYISFNFFSAMKYGPSAMAMFCTHHAIWIHPLWTFSRKNPFSKMEIVKWRTKGWLMMEALWQQH